MEALLAGIDRVVVARGRRVLTFEAPAERSQIREASLGRSGTLRAPALKVGRTLLVGWNEEAYREALGR